VRYDPAARTARDGTIRYGEETPMGMTAKKAMIIGVLGAGLVALGLMMAPAHAETITGPFTAYAGPEIKDIEAFAKGHLVTYYCSYPDAWA
jgi:hypothetical protein